jgi:hypothetical protein
VVAGLAGAAAGWVLAGVFAGGWPRAVGVLAPGAGAAVAGLAHAGWRRNPLAAWAAVPAAVVVGWLAVAAGGDSGAALPRLVAEALRSGGISQPPVAFDPGWRFILAAVLVLLASAATGLSLSLDNPRLAPLAGAAVVVLGVLVQPSHAAVLSVCGAVVLTAASLAVAVGGDGEGARAFEARRLARGAGALAGLVALLIVLSQLGFLFPASNAHQVIPPKRPETPPPAADRVLFKVKADRPLPLRLGVLDGYDGRSLLTPPYDTDRFRRIGSGRAPAGSTTVTVTIAELGGHVLPGLASPQAVVVKGAKVEVDPRTDQLRLPTARASKGLTYTVVAPPVPSAAALDGSPPPGPSLKPFTDVPPPPKPVAELVAAAPTTPYARVQYLRTALYSHVIAAGAGNPADVQPARVVDFLNGKEASPFEITAAEVLLARWAGVPARLGYGYYPSGGSGEIRPRDGATWLEAYFEGHGWVPIVGAPPRAKSSFSRGDKKQSPLVRPTDQLALVVYVPVRLTTVRLLYTVVRYWLLRAVPLALGLLLVWALVPVGLRALRRWRRRRWAAGQGGRERLLVAYAELRDALIDMNIGSPALTALEAVDVVAADEEHRQLAWLVTRGLWGDLRRDLADEDVKAGEDMAASVARRLRRAQPWGSRLGALASRASLRGPWSAEVPGGLRLPRVSRRAVLAVSAALALVVLVAVPRLGQDGGAPKPVAGGAALATLPVPDTVSGVVLRDEPTVAKAYAEAGRTSIVAEGRVLTLRRGDSLEGSLQIARLNPGVSAADADVRRAVVRSIGRGGFRLTRMAGFRVYVLDLPDQRFLLWFPPDGRSYDLLVSRATFDLGNRVFTAVLAAQRGTAAPVNLGVPVPDPRGGIPE